MRAYVVVCILGALASTCAAQDAVCATGDCGDGDRTALLQGSVTVDTNDVADHLVSESDQAMREVLKELKDELVEEDSRGWPDVSGMFKKVKAAMGGAEELEKDFDGVVAAAKAFLESASSDVKSLVSSIKPSMSIKDISSKVEHFFEQLHEAAKKLEEAVKKLEGAWKKGPGKIAPKAINDGIMSILKKVEDEAKAFTDSFKHAADALKKVDVKALCAKVKHTLHAVIKKANGLAKSAALLKHPPKDLENALKLLPHAIKDQVDKVMKKAEHAADHVLDKITKSMKDITHGVSKAFDGKCQGLPHSASAQLGASSVVVLLLGMFALSM